MTCKFIESVYTLVYMASKVIRIKENGKWKNVPWNGTVSQEREIKTRCECSRCERWILQQDQIGVHGVMRVPEGAVAHGGRQTSVSEPHTIYTEMSKEVLS